MPTKKSTKKADNSEKTTRRGRPFEKGNKYGFKPGQSGNPGGRPKRTRLTDALLAQLAELDKGEETTAEAVARALIRQALGGNVQAIREIADRTEGKPRQAIDVNATMMDWRELAEKAGLTEDDVIAEARRLIESTSDSSGA